ncbi:hypothetical protein Ciccas_010073 [Cichlidogyrus casuarinus]|uniref:Ral GTPase-activating protein subunit alpha/beta N-terminal domain-containing protein n=1 Tax=Cichlidogyrus casuarinus TaxID=1844966 RepID=A0ABD2PZR0_9PLAT
MFGKYNPNLANLIVRSVVFSLKYNGDCGCAQTNPLIPHERERMSTKSLSSSSISKEVKLETEDEIDWHLEVITFGLSMNRDLDSIRHCSHIYLQWLSCVTLPIRKTYPDEYPEYIPLAIGAKPQFYARKIILGLCNFFTPRQHEYQNVDIFGSLCPLIKPDYPHKRSGDVSSAFLAEWEDKQPTIACLIINKIQEIFLDQSAADFLEADTWDTLLQFCIASSHAILAPLIIPVRSLNTQNQECLADRAIQMLLNIWLKACASEYPPTEEHWNALAFACKQWRHRPAFVHHWHILLVLLTRQLCARYESPETKLDSAKIEVPELDYQLIYWNLILDIRDFKRVKNCWSRILNIFGNLVDLCHSSVILETPILARFL